MKTTKKIIISLVLAALVVLPVGVMKGCGSDWQRSALVPIELRLGSAGAGQAEGPLPLPWGVDLIEFEITGPGMGTILKVIVTGGMGPVTESFGVLPGPSRTFSVRAMDESGRGIWVGANTTDIGAEPERIAVLMEYVLTDTQPPEVPSGFLSSTGYGYYTLSWEPSSDGLVNAAGYYVYEVAAGEVFLTNSLTVTTMTEAGLMDGEYCVFVTAIDAAGNESAMQEEPICITVQGPTNPVPPGAPQDFKAMAVSGTRISMSWTPPSGNDNTIGYNIYNTDDPAPWYVSSAMGNTLMDTRLFGGTYCYNATALDEAANESSPTSNDCATLTGTITGPSDGVPPSTPAGLVLNPIPPGGITLAWEPSPEPDLAGYFIYEDEKGNLLYRTSSITNSLVLERLNPGTYCFAVSSVDDTSAESVVSPSQCVLLGGSANNPRVPDCPEFLSYIENPGGNYKWHPDSNPPKCYGEVIRPPKTWRKKK